MTASPPFTIEDRHGHPTRVYRTEHLAIVRCGGCKRAGRVPYTEEIAQFTGDGGRAVMEATVKAADREHSTLLTPGVNTRQALLQGRTCCGPLRVSVVKGTVHEATPCDERCTAAVGPTCRCACGGANHGAEHGAWTEQPCATM